MQPTPSPVSPSPSGRVALTDTDDRPSPSVAARRSRISSRRGAIAGRSHNTVMSQDRGAEPASETSVTVRASSSSPAMPAIGGVGVREVGTHVSERRGTQERIGERVTDHVAVGMPGKALPLEPDTCEHQHPPALTGMNVEPQADARRLIHRRHPSERLPAPGRARS